MKKIALLLSLILLTSCGYHLRAKNALQETYAHINLQVNNQSLLNRSLVSALLSSGVKSSKSSDATVLNIEKDRLRKVIQSIGANNQVQEYRLEYDVSYSIDDQDTQTLHLEKDYSFDVQQIGGGQQEELTLRKQLAEDMAWAIIRQINATLSQQ